MWPPSYDLAQMTRILLVRHGETDWNREERWQGQAGPALNERGRLQAEAVAVRLLRFAPTVLVTSDLPRAVQTAQTIADVTGLEPALEHDLREVDVGSWSGLTREEAQDSDPDGYARWLAGESGWDGGETYDQMHRRVVAVLDRLAVEHEGGTIVAVAHGGAVRAGACHAAGLPGHDRRRFVGCENCSITELLYAAARIPSLVAYNDTGHLPE
jgi:glucosyl-3-phosphoglycerate phosphatase